MVLYIALNIAVRIWLPSSSPVRVPWLVPSVEAALLALLVFGDPARLTQQRRRVHPFAVTLVVLLVAAALWATVLLVYDLIKGTGRDELTERVARIRGAGLARQQPLVRVALLADRQRWTLARAHTYIERFGELRLELLAVEQTDEPS